jgi:pyruvate, water dikinase
VLDSSGFLVTKTIFLVIKQRRGDLDIVWIGQPVCQDLALVGGKVANLSRLAAGYPVPAGLCLTTAAYTRWRVDGAGQWPPDLLEELTVGYAEMARRCGVEAPPVAVRSSAVDEDGQTSSFAGQYETYLNVIGADAVAKAVVRCWDSAQSDQVRDYRQHNHLALDMRIAVLVQQMVAADIAGVAFSANPVSQRRDEVVVNSSWGLGESVVGGTVTPDTYVVDKGNLQVRQRQIAEKIRMTVSHAEGTREVDVPRFMRLQPTLDDAKVADIARLARVLEEEMGWPTDIEWAYAGDQLYLLQCRPITTLS